MDILVDDLASSEIKALLRAHIEESHLYSPAESVHALRVEELRDPAVTFWSVRDGNALMGCGALLELDPEHGEIKSMRTVSAHLRKGVAAALLKHMIDVARQRGYRRLSLETGSMEAFAPARALYERFGFQYCPPFADYIDDPYSVFMKLVL